MKNSFIASSAKIISISFIIAFSIAITSAFSTPKTMRGIPAYTKVENMQFIELRDKNGKQIEMIGAPFEFENNQAALDCLDKAAENNQEVEISGEWESQGEGMYGFLNDTLQCKPIGKSEDTPLKQSAHLNATMGTLNNMYNERCYYLQSREDAPFQVSGFEINRGNFPYSGNKRFPPRTLKFGEQLTLFCVPKISANSIIEVQVITSNGIYTYPF